MDGYAPCWWLDFEKQYELKFKLNCKRINANGHSSVDKTHFGQKYSDV